MTPKKRQIRWTIPLGNELTGRERLARWKEAALKATGGNPKHFNTWIRRVLDTEAARIISA